MSALRNSVALLVLAAAAQTCSAHGFSGTGWIHPLTGIDHMLAMIAVGLWSARLGGRALAGVPMAFVAAMAAGSVAGYQAWPVPVVEWVIALSVIGLGAAIALDTRVLWPLACLATTIFGLAHGYAHGAEMPSSANGWSYAWGFLMTTAGLHSAGAAAGLIVLERPGGQRWLRTAGVLVAGIGAALI